MQKIFDATVRDVSLKGLGVVDHPEGKVFFVRGVWIGDHAQFEIETEDKKYGFAKLVRLIRPSPSRVDPRCSQLGFDSQSCGGCPWMIVSYQEQLAIKQRLVEVTLSRNSVLSKNTVVQKIIPSPKEHEYRNRARVQSDGKKLGYISPGTHILVDIKECLILDAKTSSQLHLLRKNLPYESKSHKELDFYDLDADIENLPQVNVPRPFKQANDEQNHFMKIWLSQKLKALDKSQSVLELFCGSGNFTEVISSFKFKNVLAVEGSKEALVNLEKKKLSYVKSEFANLFSDKAVKRLAQKAHDTEVLFLDPPRDGFEKIDQLILKMKSLKTVLYVSCDLHTFTRDSKLLIKNGFELVELQPVDQFPQTPHIEVLSLFTKI